MILHDKWKLRCNIIVNFDLVYKSQDHKNGNKRHIWSNDRKRRNRKVNNYTW